MEKQQVIALATEASDQMDGLDARASVQQALERHYGTKINDPAFLMQLVIGLYVGPVRDAWRKAALDPDVNEMGGQESLFPQPHIVIVPNDDGSETLKKIKDSTVAEVNAYYGNLTRHTKAKARKAEQSRTKVLALASVVVDSGDDTESLPYLDAVEKYGNAALDTIRTALPHA